MATIVEQFAAVGIFNRSKSEAGESQRTTGRGQTSLAAYFTGRFRVLPSGAVSYSIPLNSFTQVVDEETGEVISRTEHVEWVQVVFPHPITAAPGDHLLAIGQWQAGKQRGIAEDGTAVFWNDTLYVKEWAITPKPAKPAVEPTVTVTSVTEVPKLEGFPFGQHVSDELAEELAAGTPAKEAVRKARTRKAQKPVFDTLEDVP